MVSGGIGEVRELSGMVPEVSRRFQKVLGVGPPVVWGPHGPKGWCGSQHGLDAPAPKAHAARARGGQALTLGGALGAKAPLGRRP